MAAELWDVRQVTPDEYTLGLNEGFSLGYWCGAVTGVFVALVGLSALLGLATWFR